MTSISNASTTSEKPEQASSSEALSGVKDEESARSASLHKPRRFSRNNNNDNNHDEDALPRRWTRMALPGDDDFDDQNVPVSLTINQWAGDTSIHGVPFVADFVTWKRWKRVLWALLVCTSGALMVWQMEELISEYSKHTTITDIDTIVPSYLDFPEVTVCNYNSFSETSANASGNSSIGEAQNTDELHALAQPLDQFIWTTQFNQEERPVVGVWNRRETHHGICWSFQTNETIQRPGLPGGLFVELFMDQDDYTEHHNHPNSDGGVDSTGALIFVEEKDTPINGQRPFFTARPGHRTLASVSKTQIQRVTESPWSTCRNDVGYSQSHCRDQCLNQAQRQACGCKPFGDHADSTVPYCHTLPHEECVNSFYKTQSAAALSQCTECFLPPCFETNYAVQVSVLDFSRRAVQRYVQRLETLLGLNATQPGSEQEQHLLNLLDDNLVLVQINFDRLQSFSYTETKSMSLASLLAGLGGSMGLFLGISVISVTEFFGDLCLLRLVPRLFGRRSLYGLGARRDQ